MLHLSSERFTTYNPGRSAVPQPLAPITACERRLRAEASAAEQGQQAKGRGRPKCSRGRTETCVTRKQLNARAHFKLERFSCCSFLGDSDASRDVKSLCTASLPLKNQRSRRNFQSAVACNLRVSAR